MRYRSSIKSFFRQLSIKKMSGHQKFLAMVVWECAGKPGGDVEVARVVKDWRKSILGNYYHPNYYDRADREGWVEPFPMKRGWVTLTTEGVEHLEALESGSDSIIERSGHWTLRVFRRGQAFTFDSFLRNILAKAKKSVLFADSYVDENTLDNVVSVIPKTLRIHFLSNHIHGKFLARESRFKIEYENYRRRHYRNLHDRFMIVDDIAYIFGTSVSNATKKSPTIAVIVDRKNSVIVKEFFQSLWSQAK